MPVRRGGWLILKIKQQESREMPFDTYETHTNTHITHGWVPSMCQIENPCRCRVLFLNAEILKPSQGQLWKAHVKMLLTELFYIKRHQLESPKLGCRYITGKVGASLLFHSRRQLLPDGRASHCSAYCTTNKGRFNRMKPNLAHFHSVLPPSERTVCHLILTHFQPRPSK